MTKYCPICESEFTDYMDICPADNQPLSSEQPSKNIDYFVDLYAAADEIEAERIISFLTDAGISARESVTGLSQIPVVSDTRFILSVRRTNLTEARQLIEQAQKDLIISQTGTFL